MIRISSTSTAVPLQAGLRQDLARADRGSPLTTAATPGRAACSCGIAQQFLHPLASWRLRKTSPEACRLFRSRISAASSGRGLPPGHLRSWQPAFALDDDELIGHLDHRRDLARLRLKAAAVEGRHRRSGAGSAAPSRWRWRWPHRPSAAGPRPPNSSGAAIARRRTFSASSRVRETMIRALTAGPNRVLTPAESLPRSARRRRGPADAGPASARRCLGRYCDAAMPRSLLDQFEPLLLWHLNRLAIVSISASTSGAVTAIPVLLAGLLDDAAVDERLEHGVAMAGNALDGQLLRGDLSAVDERGGGRNGVLAGGGGRCWLASRGGIGVDAGDMPPGEAAAHDDQGRGHLAKGRPNKPLKPTLAGSIPLRR